MRDTRPGITVAGQVRDLFDLGAAGGLSDEELLERFAAREGATAEAAFTALVERHGPMVLRACRSILRDPHRAQDAFQATFLLLARRADSLWVRDSLAPWLHSVACRVASGARAAEGRRKALERRAADRASRPIHDPARDDLGVALHEEIERLPERLKAPVVLCYLEGLTHDQAADHLACPVGTVRSRLARGRDRLRRGLTRRGFAPPGHDSPPAALPASLAALAIQSARLISDRSTIGLAARWLIFLIEGVLKPMSIHPLKSAAALLLASGAIAIGLGGATPGQDPKPPGPVVANPPDRSADEARFEAIERRLRDLEAKLEEVTPPRRGNLSIQQLRHPADPDTLVKVRPFFDNALVEKVLVAKGQSVKKGDPLLTIRSAELALAKNELRTRFVQWDHDQKLLIAREPLFKDGRITHLAWVDTVNDEKKSRLEYLVAREKLEMYGSDAEQTDKLLEGLEDDFKKPRKRADDSQDLTRMTVVSPVDGVVSERDVSAGNFYDRSNVLILILIDPRKP